MKKNYSITEKQLIVKKSFNIIIVILLALVKNSYAQLPLDNNGWTVFTPHANCRIMYVSSSTGNDATALNYSATSFSNPFLPTGAIRPYKTIAAAKAQMRDGYGDWMLLSKGDVWVETFGNNMFNGLGPNYPTLYGSYGAATQRPVIKINSPNQFGFQGLGGGATPNTISNYAIVGLEFYAHRLNPADTAYTLNSSSNTGGIFILKEGANILIENCHTRFCGITVFGLTANVGSDGPITNLKLRRNIIANAYSTAGHSQGFFTDRINDTLLVEDNIFDHNGWHDTIQNAGATVFNHNLYMQYHSQRGVAVVRNNIIANGASHGVQLRSGGLIKDNLFARNSLAFFIAKTGNGLNNVDIEAKDISSSLDRGIGISVLNIVDSSRLYNNLVIKNYNSGPYNNQSIILEGDTIRNTHIDHNTTFNRGEILINHVAQANDILINQNIVQHPNKLERIASLYNSPIDTNAYHFENNIYKTGNPINNWFYHNSLFNISFASWTTITGDNSTIQLISFDDTTRNLGTYNASIGGIGSYDAFMAEASLQSKDYWRPQYTAKVVNQYLRLGYCSNLNKPIASFTFQSTGNSVQFTDNSTANAPGIVFDINSWKWNFGDGTTSTSQNPSHTYSNTGTYTVSLIVANDCRKDTITKQLVVLSSVGFNESESLISALNIYPNPSTDFLTIEYSEQPEKVLVYNTFGASVIEQVITNKENTRLQIQNLQAGVYIIGIVYKQGTVFKKITKN